DRGTLGGQSAAHSRGCRHLRATSAGRADRWTGGDMSAVRNRRDADYAMNPVRKAGDTGSGLSRRELLALAAWGLAAGVPRLAGAAGGPQSQLTWAVHVSLAPTWFDPAETSGIITPYMVLYALHDALVKPMPGQPLAPSLAESWSAAEDGLSFEFVL